MQVPEALRVAPTQVGVQHLACQVVREQPVWALLDEGQAAQPFKQCGRLGRTEDFGQQGLAGHPRARADLQGSPMSRARHLLDEAHASHQELADMIAAYRETVTLTLDDFRRRGAVELGRRSIHLLDRVVLEALAGG